MLVATRDGAGRRLRDQRPAAAEAGLRHLDRGNGIPASRGDRWWDRHGAVRAGCSTTCGARTCTARMPSIALPNDASVALHRKFGFTEVGNDDRGRDASSTSGGTCSGWNVSLPLRDRHPEARAMTSTRGRRATSTTRRTRRRASSSPASGSGCSSMRARSSRTAMFANALAGDLPADGVITGTARIDGRPVCLMANDSTVKAGSWGARTVEKIIRIIEQAYSLGVPMVWLVDSAGARITDQVQMFPGRRRRRSDLLQPGEGQRLHPAGVRVVRSERRGRRLHPRLLRRRGDGRGQRLDVPRLAAHGRDGGRRADHARGDGRRADALHRLGRRALPRARRADARSTP